MDSVINAYYDLKDNWFALFISIVKGISPDKAMMQMLPSSNKVVSTKGQKQKNVYDKFPNEDIERMIELKKSMSYKQVGKIFQTTDYNIYNHIKRYKPELIKSGVLGYNKARTGKNSYLKNSSDMKMAQ